MRESRMGLGFEPPPSPSPMKNSNFLNLHHQITEIMFRTRPGKFKCPSDPPIQTIPPLDKKLGIPARSSFDFSEHYKRFLCTDIDNCSKMVDKVHSFDNLT